MSLTLLKNLATLSLRKCVNKSTLKTATITTIKRCFANDSADFIIDSGLPDVQIPNVSIPEYVLTKCEKYDQLIATECGVTGRKYTYNEIRKKSFNLSKALRKKLNLQEGDVVAVLLPNIPEYPMVVLGALQAGLIVTTLNPIYTAEEISRQLSDSSAKALVTLNESWDIANSSIRLLKKHLPILVIKTEVGESLAAGAINFFEFTDNTVDFPDIRPRSSTDVAVLPYSSGTTGLPKGVELIHRNIVANICQNSSPDLPLIEEATSSHQDVIPAILPMFHIYGLSVNSIFLLTKGCKVVTLPKFTSDLFVSTLRDKNPHILFVVPPIILFLTTHASVRPEYLESLRTVFSGAAPLGALDEEKFLEKAGKDIHMLQGYGLTETSPTVSLTSVQLKAEKNVAGSIGKPVPNTLVKVINPDDPTGTPLGPNKPGELLIKGPQVMKSYHNRPEETKKTFLDGWLRTGDLVYYNEDKILYVTDRLKELIKVKGFQVPPAELEEIIRDFPNVEDAAVIGVPHPANGEAPRAYVVPKENCKFDVGELRDYVASKVAEYKQLSGGIAVVDTIPKNASGKILRRKLKEDYEKSINQKAAKSLSQ